VGQNWVVVGGQFSVVISIGSLGVGQIFKEWAELDDNAKAQLEKIQGQAEKLIKQSEEILIE